MLLRPSEWGFPNCQEPWIIAGPCGAESEHQIIETALQLKETGVHALRAGVWKPRSRPGTFEGNGVDALKWLMHAHQLTNLPVMVEVATPVHVEQALKAGIHMLWIGARTTVNPFLVQEIADALMGCDIPVFIKNPVNPDINLWIGAIERINRSGINKIAAIHRGFSSYENHIYRNIPNWEIPIELKRLMPDVPVFCDPSHICGNTFMIQDVAQLALDLQFDGLMIEAHHNPKDALSDANQQLLPSELKEILNNIQFRNTTFSDPVELSRLEDLRDKIDEVDFNLINTISNRMGIARDIGSHKFFNNITILQPERWREIVNTRTELGLSKGLSREFIMKLYSIIHEESIVQQTKQMSIEKDTANKKLL